MDKEARGVWYKISGNDQAFTADVTDAEFDTRLAVFTGGCGQQLLCVTSHTDSRTTSNWLSSVTFLTESGNDYYLLVTSSTAIITNVGSYTLRVTVSANCGRAL